MRSPFRFAVLAGFGYATILAFSATYLRADSISYSLVDYPLDQGSHHISGTLIANGGILTGGSVSIDNAPAFSLWSFQTSTGVYAPIINATEIALPAEGWLNFAAYSGFGYECRRADPDNPSQPDYYHVQFFVPPDVNHPYGYNDWWATTSFPTGTGHIAANDPWVIATVIPEPTTLALLIIALVGLGGTHFLRRRHL